MATLSRWDPFGDMQRLTEQMLRGWGGEMEGRAFSPAVDIYEDADAIHLKAEVPGIRPDDISIDVENHVLTIRGQRKLEREEKREGYRRIESSYGSFVRSFALPESVNTDEVEAEIEDGVLKLRIPKQAETPTKRILVKGRASGQEEKKVTAGTPGYEAQQFRVKEAGEEESSSAEGQAGAQQAEKKNQKK